MGQLVRWLMIALGGIGAALALFSVVMGAIARGVAQTLVWLAPESAGLLLVAIGLHAWIDWRTD